MTSSNSNTNGNTKSNTTGNSGVATKKILILAGGTGGHVFPGLALTSQLQERGYSVEWLGTEQGIERRLVPAAGIPLSFSNINGVRGKGLFALLMAPLKIYLAVKEARTILEKIKPDLVVGMGGFVAGPGGAAARLAKIPLIIHEQNAIAGTTNKLLSRIASVRLSAFPGALKKSECIGNPVRNEIENLPRPETRFFERDTLMRILVLGGSRGAKALNEIVPAAIAKSSHRMNCIIWHQCGDSWQPETEKIYKKLNISSKVESFVTDVYKALAWADLVICRAGALTVSELSAAGVGSILIPYPFAIDDHQTANARYMETAGAAIVKQQNDLSPEILAILLNDLLSSREKLLQMAVKARNVAQVGAAEKFADICETLLGLNKNTMKAC